MNQFFRKHGKWILAVLGVVLMFLWVMPGSSGSSGRAQVRTIGMAGKTKITTATVMNAQAELNALREMAAAQLRTEGSAMRAYGAWQEVASLVGLGDGERLRSGSTGLLSPARATLHYALLLHEARLRGVVATEAEVSSFIERFGFSDEAFRQQILSLQLTERTFRSFARNFLSVTRLLESSSDAIQVTLPDVEHYLADARSGVSAAYVALESDKPPAGILIADDDIKSLARTNIKKLVAAKILTGENDPRLADPAVLKDLEKALAPEIEKLKADARAALAESSEAPGPEINGRKYPAGHRLTAEDLRKQIEAYKDVLPGTAAGSLPEIAGHKYPFGYKFPDRVAVEYLKIPFADVKKIVAPFDSAAALADEKEAFKAFLAKENVAPGIMEMPATAPAATMSAQAIELQKKWEAKRGEFMDKQIERRALAKARDIAERCAGRSVGRWTQIDDKGYRVIPSDKSKGDLDLWSKYSTAPAAATTPAAMTPAATTHATATAGTKPATTAPATAAAELGIAEMFTASSSVDVQEIDANGRKSTKTYRVNIQAFPDTGLLAADELSKIPGLGLATFTRPTGEKVYFADLAMHVYPLQKVQTGVPLQLLLQVGAEGPVLFDSDNNAYVFRVREAIASHAPESQAEFDELASRAAEDLKRVAYYLRLKNQAEVLRARVSVLGIKAAATAAGHIPKVTDMFTRASIVQDATGRVTFVTPPIDSTLGIFPAFTAAAFELAHEINRPVDHFAVPEVWDSVPRVTWPSARVVSSDERLSAYVLQVNAYQPLPVNILKEDVIRGTTDLRLLRSVAFMREWSSLKQVAARVSFKLSEGSLDERE